MNGIKALDSHPHPIFRLLREPILIGIAPDGRLEFCGFPSSSNMAGYLPVSMKDGNSVEKQQFFTGKPRK